MRTCCQLVGLVLAGVVLLGSPGHEAPGMSTGRLSQETDLASGRFPCFRWSIEDARRPATMPADPTRDQGQFDRAIIVDPDQIRRN